MSSNHQEHSYGELREAVIAVMLDRGSGAGTFDRLMERTALQLRQRDGTAQRNRRSSRASAARLHPTDSELILEIVWDLFRQGILTLGENVSNPGVPRLRLTRFGESALRDGPYRFHDNTGFIRALRSEAADISPASVVYLREAVTAFYAGCLLSACAMLGIAAESEFLRLLDFAKSSKTHGHRFSHIGDGLDIGAKISRFQEAIKPVLNRLSRSATDEMDNNLNTIQSVIQTARNQPQEASDANPPPREQVYLYLQRFIPFAAQSMRLRRELSEPAYPRLVAERGSVVDGTVMAGLVPGQGRP